MSANTETVTATTYRFKFSRFLEILKEFTYS